MALTYIFGSSFSLTANDDTSNKPPCMVGGPIFCSLDITNNFNIHCYQKHITLKCKTLFQCWGFLRTNQNLLPNMDSLICKTVALVQGSCNHFSRTTLYFQGPPTSNIIHTLYKKAHSQSILIGL